MLHEWNESFPGLILCSPNWNCHGWKVRQRPFQVFYWSNQRTVTIDAVRIWCPTKCAGIRYALSDNHRWSVTLTTTPFAIRHSFEWFVHRFRTSSVPIQPNTEWHTLQLVPCQWFPFHQQMMSMNKTIRFTKKVSTLEKMKIETKNGSPVNKHPILFAVQVIWEWPASACDTRNLCHDVQSLIMMPAIKIQK